MVTVVGVVGDARQWTLEGEPAPAFCYSLWQWPDTKMFLVVRTLTDPETIVAAVRKIAGGIDPAAAVSDVRTMEDRVAESFAGRQANTAVLSVFGARAVAGRSGDLRRHFVHRGSEDQGDRRKNGSGRHATQDSRGGSARGCRHGWFRFADWSGSRGWADPAHFGATVFGIWTGWQSRARVQGLPESNVDAVPLM